MITHQFPSWIVYGVTLQLSFSTVFLVYMEKKSYFTSNVAHLLNNKKIKQNFKLQSATFYKNDFRKNFIIKPILT